MHFKSSFIASLATGLLTIGCAKKPSTPAAAPAVEVGVITVASRPITASEAADRLHPRD